MVCAVNKHLDARLLDPAGADELVRALQRRGFSVIAPAIEDDIVVLREYGPADTLPRGYSDTQDGGSYRLTRTGDDRLFAYAAAPQGFKRVLWPPRQTLYESRRTADRLEILPVTEEPKKLALFAARACEIDAIAILDGVFDNGDFADPGYWARRRDAFVVLVECGRSGDTCFCASMGTGPAREAGFDIALTEIFGNGPHRLLARAGSERGAEVLAEIAGRPATAGDADDRNRMLAEVAAAQARRMPADVAAILAANPEHARWNAVAERCLTCGNCTMVCPTCFCSTTEDSSSLDMSTATRARRWDSCFTIDYSYIHGGAVRASARSRYRQWISHKLSTWHEQFGRAGCVGCGRCITWCPVGIDIVEEANAIAASSA